MANKNRHITLYKKIWARIRYCQNLYEMSDSELALNLQVCERTLRDYDKSARCLTLEKVDNFLTANKMSLDELMTI